MKSFIVTAALFASTSLAFLPSCQFNDCLGSWDGGSCEDENGWACVCEDGEALAQLNTCVATSCGNETDQEAIYGAIAQLCANNGATPTNTEQAAFSATSGGDLLSAITPGPSGGFGPRGAWDGDSWSSWIESCSDGLGGPPGGWKNGGGPWSAHSGWGGPGGNGGGPGGRGGRGGFGPWGTKADGINCDSWTTWTAGWGPFSSWTGTWSGCSSTTNDPVPATVTTTVVGSDGQTQILTGTTFGIQAVASDSGAIHVGQVSTVRGIGAFVAVAGGVFAAMIAL